MLTSVWANSFKYVLCNPQIIFTILAATSASPVLLAEHYSNIPVAKSTFTQSSQLVDHGSTYHAVPVFHTVEPSKKTVTSSSQVVNHGGTTILHTPVHYEVHSVPVVKSHVQEYGTIVHAPVVTSPVVYHSSPVVVKTGDSAVSHQSSTVHETVPIVNSVPLYSLHH